MPAGYAKRILILKFSSFGDIIHTIPALSSLRKGYPDSEIVWMVDERWRALLEGNPDLNSIMPVHKKKLISSLFAGQGAVNIMRSLNPDICVDFQGLFYTGFLSRLSGAKKRVGFASAREFSPFFYTDRARIPFEGIHAVQRYLKLAVYAGGAETPAEFKIQAGEDDRRYIQPFLKESLRIAIHPSARWNTKRWQLEKFAKVADYLAGKYNVQIIIIGAGEDVEYNSRVKSFMRSEFLDLTGKTNLKQLTALFEKIDLLITNDSGPMHLAAALGRPVLAIFGPTDPVRTGPYGQSQNVIRQVLTCSPCLKKKCNHLKCMLDIPAEVVMSAADKILERTTR
ncbi:MAG: glycosyltransferase family 9 protein [Candidatus Omnitrophica bacterium]|nr:glycosyltransferase family 9 protein [Candidatus Omnitrophota bacterium]